MSLCAHCGSTRIGAVTRTDVDDDAGWVRLAAEHDLPCKWVSTRGRQLRLVFTLLPHNGTRVTATLWRVGQLGAAGTFVPVSPPLSKDEAARRESVLRETARKVVRL